MQRRKTLLNSLNNTHILNNKEQGEIILRELGINNNIRAENLSIEDFKKIYDKLNS